MTGTKLSVEIQKLRGIESLKIDLDLSPGIYAFTGKNGSGKSTLIAVLAGLFYKWTWTNFFFNSTENGTHILYNVDNSKLKVTPGKPYWKYTYSPSKFYLNGFYEGSIIHGNRFRDSNFGALFQAAKVKTEQLIKAESFVSENLGLILHNDRNHYPELYRILNKNALQTFEFRGSPYFLKLQDGKLISQFSLSTGENLLISILHSIQHQVPKTKKASERYLILLDEVELALHPSALVKLIIFLKDLSKTRGFAIFFSTHSIELLRQIPPNNIYNLHKHVDNTIEVINPCYPAYATRNIYAPDGYDVLIFVEDELAKRIINWTIRKTKLSTSRLIHVVPAGGWENVITLHQEVITSHIFGHEQKALSILDGDVEKAFDSKYKSQGLHGNLNIAFLPIKSAEKYLRDKLITNVDHSFFRDFGDSFFRVRALEDVIQEYISSGNKDTDTKGKVLLKALKKELFKSGLDEKDFYSYLTEYIERNENMSAIENRIKTLVN